MKCSVPRWPGWDNSSPIQGLDQALASVLQLDMKRVTVIPWVRAFLMRWQVGLTTRLHSFCKEGEYKLACISQIKGRIALQNAELMPFEV